MNPRNWRVLWILQGSQGRIPVGSTLFVRKLPALPALSPFFTHKKIQIPTPILEHPVKIPKKSKINNKNYNKTKIQKAPIKF